MECKAKEKFDRGECFKCKHFNDWDGGCDYPKVF